MFRTRSLLLLITLAVAITSAPSTVAAGPECADCHDEWFESAKARQNLHPPFDEDDCSSCHEDHGDSERLMLVEVGSALCFQCHDEPAEGSKIHPIIEDEGCLGCHDPHGSANRRLLTEPAEDLCAGCHDDVMSGAIQHEAATGGGCTDCHNPHASVNSRLLYSEPPALCADCHDDPPQEGRMHSIIEEDGCTACHNPHSAPNKTLLSTPADELCQECHDSMIEGPVVHEAVSEGSCTDCHSPHESGERALLLSDQASLCGECHEILGPLDKMLHTALSDGDCTDCHLPHSAGQQKLLISAYNIERFPKGFSEEMYDLCFQCHEPFLVTAEDDEKATNFRDGSRNLHSLHVQGGLKPNKYGIVKRGKARSCSVCHSPHGSSQAFDLIREYSCQGVFCFTMTYYPLEDGGKCMVGCHKPQSYHREGEKTASQPTETIKR